MRKVKHMEITESIARKVLEVVDAGLVDGLGVPIPGKMCVEAAVCYAMGLPHDDEPSCVSPSLRSLKIRLNDFAWSSKEARAKGLRRLAVAQLGSADKLDEREFVRRVINYAIRVSTPKALRIAANLHHSPEHKQALRDAAERCEVEGNRDALDAARDATACAYSSSRPASRAAAVASAARAATAAAAASAAWNSIDASYSIVASAASGAYHKDAAHSTNAEASTYGATVAAHVASAAASGDKASIKRDRLLSEYAEVIVQILIDMNAPGCQWLPLTESGQ